MTQTPMTSRRPRPRNVFVIAIVAIAPSGAVAAVQEPPVKAIGRVAHDGRAASTILSLCELARSARAGNSPEAAVLEAGCRAVGEQRPAAPSSSRFESVVYNAPTIIATNGERVTLDLCRNYAKECGKPAADAFCRIKGHTGALRYGIATDIGRTAMIDDGRICDEPGCDGFSKIECEP